MCVPFGGGIQVARAAEHAAVKTAVSPDKAYLAAVDQMIAHKNIKNPTVTWAQLRAMYTQTSFYQPHAGQDHVWNILQAAAQKALLEDTPEAVSAYQQLLRDHYAHYRSHLQAIEMIEKAHFTGEDKALHLAALRGILSSILESGTGQTAETAYHVIDTQEENLILQSYFHYKPMGSKYEQHNGHVWDVRLYQNPGNGAEGKMYFDVDAIVKAAR